MVRNRRQAEELGPVWRRWRFPGCRLRSATREQAERRADENASFATTGPDLKAEKVVHLSGCAEGVSETIEQVATSSGSAGPLEEFTVFLRAHLDEGLELRGSSVGECLLFQIQSLEHAFVQHGRGEHLFR